MKIDFETIIPKFDEILERGLCAGIGSVDGQMCIEAAITQAMDLPFSDNPSCVEPAVRHFKISLNDSGRWTGPEERAKALRNIGIAQIGSRGIVNGTEFTARLASKTISIMIPMLFREIFKDLRCLAAADRCEKEGTAAAAKAANDAAHAAHAANAAAYAAHAAHAAANAAHAAANAAADAAYAANAAHAAANAAYAANAAAKAAKYLILSANLALDVLRELKSPGCEWIDWGKQ